MPRLPFLSHALVAGALALGAAAAMASDGEQSYQAGVQAAEDLRYAEALRHFSQAAAEGHAPAMRTAGLMLFYGEKLYGPEIRQNRGSAIRLLRQAAGLGCEVSASVLKQHETRPQS